MPEFFPPLPLEWEATRATLHAYTNGIGAIPRVHAVPHPRWWHISLRVRPTGLVTDAMALPGGGTFQVRMDLRNHEVVIESSRGDHRSIGLTAGLTGTQFGEAVIDGVASLGVEGDYARQRFADDEAGEYDLAAAEAFFTAVVNAAHTFERHRATLAGPVGPVQLWPHGFDLSFEWFGTKVETQVEDGRETDHPAQLNLGFYPGGRAYFYSNPWPFDEGLVGKPLPVGAEWHTEDWLGTVLYYDKLQAAPDGAERLLTFARAVHDLVVPTLMA